MAHPNIQVTGHNSSCLCDRCWSQAANVTSAWRRMILERTIVALVMQPDLTDDERALLQECSTTLDAIRYRVLR